MVSDHEQGAQEDRVLVDLSWEESNDVLYALRHPRGNKETLEWLAKVIGTARIKIASDVATELMTSGG